MLIVLIIALVMLFLLLVKYLFNVKFQKNNEIDYAKADDNGQICGLPIDLKDDEDPPF